MALIMRLAHGPSRTSLALLILACCAALGAAADRAANSAAPRIEACRIGFDGYFKVGCWTPVWVDVGGDAGDGARLEITTLDSDGVEVTVPHPIPASSAATKHISVLVYVQVGRLTSPIKVAIVDADGDALDRYEFPNGRGDENSPPCIALPVTSELIVHFGAKPIGLEAAVADRGGSDGVFDRNVAHVSNAADLPSDWLGYDGIDVLFVTTADAALANQFVSAERPQFAAVRRWIELGGRMVIGCGQNAPSLLAASSPLAAIVPGEFAELVRLPQTRTIETFAANAAPIGEGPVAVAIGVPLLTDVSGRVELFGQGENLPLVIRAARGFGEVTFFGLDVDAVPLAEWTGRADLLQAILRPYLSRVDYGAVSRTLVSAGYDDIAGALRQRLGRSFAGVTIITFPIVAAAIIMYLLLIGPFDFFLVQRWIRRPWVAWLSFPSLVLLACGVAAWCAQAAKHPGGQQLNAVEVVDFDAMTSDARGTCWATLYSPDANRYSCQIDPRMPDGNAATDAASQLSNWGLPGAGLGGMHASGAGIDVALVGYQSSPALDELVDVPILTASTKSLLARWQQFPGAISRPLVESQLSVDDDGLLVGTFVNQTGIALDDACLLHGGWGYTLGDIKAGGTVEVGPQRTVNRTKTIILRRARRSSDTPQASADRDLFLADRATVDEFVNILLFYQAAGGYDFVRLPNRFQSQLDMSRLLELDRAVLVADGASAGSRWVDSTTGEPLVVAEQDNPQRAIYRFVLPVDREPSASNN